MLPSKELDKGDEWESEYDFSAPMMGDLSVLVKSKLKDIKSGAAGKSKIEFENDVSLLSSDSPLGDTAEFGEFKMKGKAEFGLGAGRLLKREVSLKADVSIGGQSSGMKMTVINNLKVELVDED